MSMPYGTVFRHVHPSILQYAVWHNRFNFNEQCGSVFSGAVAHLHEAAAVRERVQRRRVDLPRRVLDRPPHPRRRHRLPELLKRRHDERDTPRRTRRRHRGAIHQLPPLLAPLRHRRDGAAGGAEADACVAVCCWACRFSAVIACLCPVAHCGSSQQMCRQARPRGHAPDTHNGRGRG